MYLGWRGEVPTSWWAVSGDKQTDVLGQRWRTRRGQKQKGGPPLVLMLEKWSQLENFCMHVSPLPSEKTDWLDQHSISGELCPYW